MIYMYINNILTLKAAEQDNSNKDLKPKYPQFSNPLFLQKKSLSILKQKVQEKIKNDLSLTLNEHTRIREVIEEQE